MLGAFSPLMTKTVTIRRETRFMAKGDDKTVSTALVKLLTELKANPTVKGKEIKGYIQYGPNLISFAIDIAPTSGGFCMVEVRRGKGTILDYNKFYRILNDELKKTDSIIASTPVQN